MYNKHNEHYPNYKDKRFDVQIDLHINLLLSNEINHYKELNLLAEYSLLLFILKNN